MLTELTQQANGALVKTHEALRTQAASVRAARANPPGYSSDSPRHCGSNSWLRRCVGLTRPGLNACASGSTAFEVNRATRVTAADLKGLKAFQTDDPEATCLLLSFCPEPLLINGIRCEPLEGWLRRVRP